jgi:flavin reductase (DIM6/NTAB) family NADH-FMN oxidoreductase RutF
VVTSEVEGRLLGLTVSSFNAVSLAPPLILFSLARSAQTFPLWTKAPHFGITVLAEHESHLSNRFARGGADKWNGVAPLRGANGVPL